MTEMAEGRRRIMTEDPTEQAKAACAEWRKLSDEHWARVDAMWAEVARHQQQGVEQLGTVIDQTAKLAKGAVQMAHEVTAEALKLAHEAAKRVHQTWTSALPH
jgi:hypothetical protein